MFEKTLFNKINSEHKKYRPNINYFSFSFCELLDKNSIQYSLIYLINNDEYTFKWWYNMHWYLVIIGVKIRI